MARRERWRREGIQERWNRESAHLKKKAAEYRFDNIEDLQWPREVWAAVDGDPAPLVELLRSKRPIGRQTRDALADLHEGKLEQTKLPRHRLPTQSKLGFAWYRYDKAREFIRRKGWHRKNAKRYWPPERLLKAVARKEGVSENALENRARRAKRKLPSSPAGLNAWLQANTSKAAVRQEIARKIHSKK